MSSRHPKKVWLLFTLVTVLAWGIWGAFSNRPIEAGFPDLLVYVVWSLTMIPPALVALAAIGWKIDTRPRSVVIGFAVGLLGAGGQLLLFRTLRFAPAWLVFPLIALSPIVTVILAMALSGERATVRGWIGIGLALAAGILVSWSPLPAGGLSIASGWVAASLLILLAWGIQGFLLSAANRFMRAESIFFYMTISGLLLAPVALAMTDLSRPISYGWDGAALAAATQILNSAGALLLVYAFRYGRAIIVAPLINAGAPALTILLSLVLTRTHPHPLHLAGVAAAILAVVLMSLEDETPGPAPAKDEPGL